MFELSRDITTIVSNRSGVSSFSPKALTQDKRTLKLTVVHALPPFWHHKLDHAALVPRLHDADTCARIAVAFLRDGRDARCDHVRRSADVGLEHDRDVAPNRVDPIDGDLGTDWPCHGTLRGATRQGSQSLLGVAVTLRGYSPDRNRKLAR